MKGVRRAPGLGIDFLLALSLLGVLFTLTWFIWFAPRIGASFLVTIVVVVLVLVLVLVLALAFGVSATLKRPGALSSVRVIWPAFLAPLLGGGALTVSAARWAGIPDWAIQGDMVWNTATALFINTAGGVVFETQANPAPLTNAIFALAYGVDPSFETTLKGNATVLIIVLVLASALSGLYAAQQTSQASIPVRFLLVVAVGWLPFTAIALDGVFRLGLANVLTSYLALWVIWVVYMAGDLSWHHRVALLLAASTVMLASWAPLAVIPCALAMVVCMEQRQILRVDWKRTRNRFLVPALGLAQLIGYVLVVTLPDLRKAGSHLGANGAFPPLDASEALVLILIFLIVALHAIQVLPKFSEGRKMAAGTLAVLITAVPVFVYLVMQRGAGESYWGYYPMKFASLLVFLFVGVSIVTIAAFIEKHHPLSRQFVIGATAIPMYLIAVLAPMQWALGSYTFAPALVAAATSPNPERMEAIRDLAVVQDADLEGIEVFVDWIPEQDALANTYLFQLAVDRGDDPLRGFAYTFDPSDRGQFCDVVSIAKQPVTVFTRSSESAFQSRYLRTCDDANSVTVMNSLPG